MNKRAVYSPVDCISTNKHQPSQAIAGEGHSAVHNNEQIAKSFTVIQMIYCKTINMNYGNSQEQNNTYVP